MYPIHLVQCTAGVEVEGLRLVELLPLLHDLVADAGFLLLLLPEHGRPLQQDLEALQVGGLVLEPMFF